MGFDDFPYDEEHGIVVCRRCGTGLGDTERSWKRHLRAEPHRMKGDTLSGTVKLLATYELRTKEELRRRRPDRAKPCRPIEGLRTYAGHVCACDGASCDFATRRIEAMYDHMPRHGKTASQHRRDAPLWVDCELQTYFTASGLIDYFVVARGGAGEASSPPVIALLAPPSSKEEGKLFDGLREDVGKAGRDLDQQAGIVQDVGRNRADRVPWLVRTGFPTHLRGLADAEIKSSYSLPPTKRVAGHGLVAVRDDDADLVRILVATEAVVRDAYLLCGDRSPDGKMTQQRAKRLGEFHAGGPTKAQSVGFRCFKNESTLVTYIRKLRQLVTYYYRVVYREDGHFTRRSPGHTVPRDTIVPTPRQQQCMEAIIGALRQEDNGTSEGGGVDGGDRDDELGYAVRHFWVALICQEVGSRPFRSPVLSFCAMLSRKVFGRGEGDRKHEEGVWYEPGDFNSNLSALTWIAQLMLFDFACFHKQDDEDGIPGVLDRLCSRYMHQMTETPFGHILQWRLYLFAVAKTTVARNQARWSMDGQMITYMGTQLHMQQVSKLIESEYRQAHSILFDELLFGADDIAPIEAWRLHDDLDVDDYGGSWLTDGRNAEVLEGAKDALLRQIEGRPALRRVFVRAGENGNLRLCPKAIAVYEAHVQEFLKRLVTLILLAPGPPVRVPELLSVTYANTSRQRGTMIWEKMVMLYIRYHKSQEQTGAEKNNIRFLPRSIGDLLLTYLALVPPLRQVFLRRESPGALLSPYLWSTLDGEVWRDSAVSQCLRKACARADVPQFQVAWWRQVAASITKEKFGASERANFDMEDVAAAEEVEDEAELADLAGMSNHSFRTFNHAYAGSTTLTMSTLLHRAYRASHSWRSFFRVDQILEGKRPRAMSGGASIVESCKKARYRSRPTMKEDGLVAVARRLHNDPDLRLRQPGQRDAMLAVLGPRPAEQVIVVLATGSGKTLIAMVAAALEDAGTTVLVVPTVALRTNMLDKFTKAGVKHVEWSPGSSRAAPLVIVSVEAACTESFLQYIRRLEDRQQLDRIVVDECHLTITASSYRRSMSQLGWYVRSVRTQTAWLTATLPPAFEEVFIEHNKLVRPRIVRESTNRPNIRYTVRRERGPGSMCERAADLVRSCCARRDVFDGGRDRIILYCVTKEDVSTLAALLDCPSYTGDSGTEQDKEAILARWLGPSGSPAIAATSALSVGFDYPHVRWVIHVGAPSLMSDFSQETGRAGRDGKAAESITLISAAWAPRANCRPTADQESMELYLTQKHCSRAVMSQFLDARRDWTWCTEGDELCGACPRHHADKRSPEVEFRLPNQTRSGAESGDDECPAAGAVGATEGGDEMQYTGPREVLRQARVREEALTRYESDLELMLGCCLYCRVGGKPFEHKPGACARRHDWIRAKGAALDARRKEGKKWMDNFVVCWKCYQPQSICRTADPEAEVEGTGQCRFPDMVMPLCYGAFWRPGRTRWFEKHFNQAFKTMQEYMLWLGQTATMGGSRCIQANCVAAVLLAELG